VERGEGGGGGGGGVKKPILSLSAENLPRVQHHMPRPHKESAHDGVKTEHIDVSHGSPQTRRIFVSRRLAASPEAPLRYTEDLKP